MRLLRRRPSPATAIALVALFAALGGTAWAAVRITGRQVVNGSLDYHDIKAGSLGTGVVQGLRGRDLRNGAIGGAQVNESDLGKVPSAGAADSAGGLFPRKVFAKLPANGPEQTVLSLSGMSLLASCPGGVVRVRAITATSDTELAAQAVAASNAARGVRAGDFDIGESVDVVQGLANGHLTLSYATGGGGVATAALGFGSTSSFGATSPGCSVYGTAQGG